MDCLLIIDLYTKTDQRGELQIEIHFLIHPNIKSSEKQFRWSVVIWNSFFKPPFLSFHCCLNTSFEIVLTNFLNIINQFSKVATFSKLLTLFLLILCNIFVASFWTLIYIIHIFKIEVPQSWNRFDTELVCTNVRSNLLFSKLCADHGLGFDEAAASNLRGLLFSKLWPDHGVGFEKVPSFSFAGTSFWFSEKSFETSFQIEVWD